MTQDEIRDLADDALNVACKHIQDKLGVPTGDVAGMFFSGKADDDIRALLESYIRSELNWMGFPANPPADERESNA